MRFFPRFFTAGAFFVGIAGAAPEPAAPPAPSCTRGAASALSELACELGRGLGEPARGALVVGAEPSADAKVAVRPELAVRLAALVAGSLGPEASAWPKPEGNAHARLVRAGSRPLVVVHTVLRGERIEVTADALASRPRLWQRLRGAKAGTLAHAFAERPIDGEVRSFLPPVPLVARDVRRVSGSDPDVIAVACGDVDGDGAAEIATVGRYRVSLGRLRHGRFESVASRPFSALSAVAPAPLREPIASVWVRAPGLIDVGVTDRARPLRLDARLTRLHELEGALPFPSGGCLGRDGVALASRVSRCVPGEVAAVQPPLDGPVDAFAGALVVMPSGKARFVRAGRKASDASVTLRDANRNLVLPRAGAQIAVGDLDGDGTAELATSVDTLVPAEDALIVYSVANDTLRERFRVPVPSGVRAIGVCPSKLDAMAPLVIATGDGLWLIQ
jgi:hypothetical protein